MRVSHILAKKTVMVASVDAGGKLTKLSKSPKFGRYGTDDVWISNDVEIFCRTHRRAGEQEIRRVP
jgi:hypothetical protein